MGGFMCQLISILLIFICHVQGKDSNYDSFHGDAAIDEFSHDLDTESDTMGHHEASGDYISNADHIDHFPMEPETKTSGVHKLHLKPNRCYYYPDKGSCNRFYRRYYYDHVFNTCKPFVYSGCGGNNNRFYTRSGCMKTCAV